MQFCRRSERDCQLALESLAHQTAKELTANESTLTMRLTSILLLISLFAMGLRTFGQTNHKLSEAQTAALKLNEQGVAQAKARQYEAAVASFREAIRRESRHSGFYKNLGVAYLNWARPGQALEPLQEAVRLKPNCGESHFYLAIAKSELAWHVEAITSYEDAARHGWTSAELYSNLGWSYYLAGQHKKALAPLRLAASLAPNDPLILNNLGVVSATLGRHDEAAAALRTALRLKPAVALTHYNLGLIYAAKGDRRAALQQHKILNALAPDLGKVLYKEIYRDLLIVLEK